MLIDVRPVRSGKEGLSETCHLSDPQGERSSTGGVTLRRYAFLSFDDRVGGGLAPPSTLSTETSSAATLFSNPKQVCGWHPAFGIATPRQVGARNDDVGVAAKCDRGCLCFPLTDATGERA